MSDQTCLDVLVEAGTLAPSGDNTQPWRLDVDRAGNRITLDIDPERDPSPMNAGQRMARISLGAVLENMARTAEHNGWGFDVVIPPERGLAQFRVDVDELGGDIDPLLRRRVTNRRVYDGGDLDEERLADMRSSVPPRESVTASWVTDRRQRQTLVELIAKADGLMLSYRRIRDAFLAKVRFDVPVDAAVDEGLSLGSLEVNAIDRFLLRCMSRWSIPDGLLQAAGGRRTLGGLGRRLAGSASGFCIIASKSMGPQADLSIGRTWQSAWLACTRVGVATQPMMSLLVLQNIFDHEGREFFHPRDRDTVEGVLDRFGDWASDLCDGAPAAIMRIGIAPPPTARVGRRRHR